MLSQHVSISSCLRKAKSNSKLFYHFILLVVKRNLIVFLIFLLMITRIVEFISIFLWMPVFSLLYSDGSFLWLVLSNLCVFAHLPFSHSYQFFFYVLWKLMIFSYMFCKYLLLMVKVFMVTFI